MIHIVLGEQFYLVENLPVAVALLLLHFCASFCENTNYPVYSNSDKVKGGTRYVKTIITTDVSWKDFTTVSVPEIMLAMAEE